MENHLCRYEVCRDKQYGQIKKLVNIMGGTVIGTESERLIRKGRELGEAKGEVKGRAKEIVEMGQEFGLDDASILKRMQDKIGLSLE